MADRMTPSQRHDCMSNIHGKDTGPELTVRKELWRRGYRYRFNVHGLPGTPDIVMSRYRTAIFVNGCFWHGHKGCSKYTVPKSNTAFWKEKIARNQERDLLNNQRLESLAWNVITVWECELSKSNLPVTIERLDTQLKENKAKWEAYKAYRRSNRQFALEQSRKHREIAAAVAAELNIPAKIMKASMSEEE